MAGDDTTRAQGLALAGGAITAALLETLYAKGILTLDEGRGILDKAMRRVGIHKTPEAAEAFKVIGDMQRGPFSARG